MQSSQEKVNVKELVRKLIEKAESCKEDNQKLANDQKELRADITKARKQLSELKQGIRKINSGARLCNRKFEYQQQTIDCFFYQAQWSFVESLNSGGVLKLFKHLVSLVFKNFIRDWTYLIDDPEKIKEIKLNDFKEYFSQLADKYVKVIANGSNRLSEYKSQFNLLIQEVEGQTQSVDYQSSQEPIRKDFSNMTLETFLKELIGSTEKYIEIRSKLISQNSKLQKKLKFLLAQNEKLLQKEREIRRKLENLEDKFEKQQNTLLNQIIKDPNDIKNFQEWFSTQTRFCENNISSFVESLRYLQNSLKSKLSQLSTDSSSLKSFKHLQSELYDLANELIANLLKELLIDNVNECIESQNQAGTILKTLLTPSIVWPIIEQLITCSNKSLTQHSSLYTSIRNHDTSQVQTMYQHFLQSANNNETENNVIAQRD